MKVKVILKSNYTKSDIEAILSEAYEDENLILDFMKEDDKYIYLYLKEKSL